MERFPLTATLTLAFVSSVAFAGGTDEQVQVESFRSEGFNYVLVVAPVVPARDSLFGRCEKLVVRGTYRTLKGSGLHQPSILSKAAHVKALEHLREAHSQNRQVAFGSMGEGLKPVRESNPCVVESRALLLMETSHGSAVISFHNAI